MPVSPDTTDAIVPTPAPAPRRSRAAKTPAAAKAAKVAAPKAPKPAASKSARPKAAAGTPAARRKTPAAPPGDTVVTADAVATGPQADAIVMAEGRLRVLVVASECAPFASSGDLGEAVARVVTGLAQAGHEVTLVLPRFDGVLPDAAEGDLWTIDMGDRRETIRWFHGDPAPRVHLAAVDHAAFFSRQHFYGADGGDYPDNPRRFAVLAMAAFALAEAAPVPFDVIHAFDWQAGLVPVLVHARAQAVPHVAQAAVVFTVNGPGFQGRCGREWLAAFGLDDSYASVGALEYWGGLSLLKGGVNFADLVTVPDPERAVTTPGGYGFEGIFASRGEMLVALDITSDTVGAQAEALYRRARRGATRGTSA